jgi:hypothetical protein
MAKETSHSDGVPHLKDSGHREQMATGSQRDSRTGKGRYDLLPFRAIRRVAKIYEVGAIKYHERNWELGQTLQRYMESGLRHLGSYMEGMKDEDHLAQAAWNILGALETEERIEQGLLPAKLDDLPGNPTGWRHPEEHEVLSKLRNALEKSREAGVASMVTKVFSAPIHDG